MRLITWNVAQRLSRLPEQAAALASRAPDVVCLQEVTVRSLELWRMGFERIGLAHVFSSLDGVAARHGVLIASRAPLEPAAPLAVPRPQSVASARVEGVEVHCAHVPNAANGIVKPDTLAAIRAGLAARAGGVGGGGGHILAGDLNTPRRELPDGTVWSFARDGRGRMRAERAGHWDESELGVVPGLADLGFADAFRALHGYASREPSWVWPTHRGGWRLDHVFTSPPLVPIAAAYHHDWRDSGLSDHSALEVDVDVESR